MIAYHINGTTADRAEMNISQSRADELAAQGWLISADPIIWAEKQYVNSNLQDIPQPESPAPYTPTLDEVKTQKRNEINRGKTRDEAETPFIYLEKQFDFDSLSRERLNVAIQLAQSLKIAGAAGTQKVTDWKLYDNTMFEFTVDALCSMPQAFAQRSAELHQKAWTLKAQVESATTVEEVNAINW